MEYFRDKVEYLKIICSNYGFDKNTNEGKVFSAITDILSDMAKVLDTVIEQFDDENNEEHYEYAFICPECMEEIEVSQFVFENEEEIVCPKCGNIVPVCATDFSDDDFNL